MNRLLPLMVLIGCSSDGTPSPAPDAAACIVDPAGAVSLTSTAFASCAAIPTANTCKGANSSPVLAWAGAPAGTQSFAVVLTDLSIGLVHWVIYDIPASATGLPAGVEKAYAPGNASGAHQTTGYDSATAGYLGPCPPSTHTYKFVVYALDAASLPGATAATTRDQAIAAITAHKLASASLTGTYP